MADPVSRRLLAGMVKDRLESDPLLVVYVGEVDPPPELIPNTSRVKPYVVLFSGDGTPIDEKPLNADETGSLSWSFFATIGAGYHDDALAVLDAVHGLLDGWFPVLTGYQFGMVRQPPGFDPGPVRPDTSVEPARFTIAPQFVVDAVHN